MVRMTQMSETGDINRLPRKRFSLRCHHTDTHTHIHTVFIHTEEKHTGMRFIPFLCLQSSPRHWGYVPAWNFQQISRLTWEQTGPQYAGRCSKPENKRSHTVKKKCTFFIKNGFKKQIIWNDLKCKSHCSEVHHCSQFLMNHPETL